MYMSPVAGRWLTADGLNSTHKLTSFHLRQYLTLLNETFCISAITVPESNKVLTLALSLHACPGRSEAC